MTGFVGDSLTVLDRSRSADPLGTAGVVLAITLLTLVVGAVAARLTGVGSTSLALLFGLTMALWVLEDTVRRLLMATMRFWSVVAVDLVHASTAIGWLWFVWTRNGGLSLSDFMVALLVGQSVALVVGLLRAPREERRVTSWRRCCVERGRDVRRMAGGSAGHPSQHPHRGPGARRGRSG